MLMKPFLTLCALLIAGYGGEVLAQIKDPCHDLIRKAVCLVDAPSTEKERYKMTRTCLSGSEKYQQPFIQVYDTFPPFAQQAVCSLKKIYIEKSFYGSAWSALDDDSKPETGMIGIRQSDMDAGLGLEDYNTWFEQQTFGGAEDFKISPDLPRVRVYPESKKHLHFLTYTLLHEIGHILDFQWHFNRIYCLEDQTQCRPVPRSWTEFSWTDFKTPNAASHFDLRKRICINACHGKFLLSEETLQLYPDLFNHGFISQLAAFDANEDWAETFAVYVNAKYMNIHYQIILPTGETYRLDDMLRSQPFKGKKKYLDTIFSN